MTATTTDLAPWLRAQIAEDEAALEGAADCQTWQGVDRELAVCAAHRRIVEWHTDGHYCSDEGNMESWYLPEAPCPTLRALAAVYADHPDYREEWRP